MSLEDIFLKLTETEQGSKQRSSTLGRRAPAKEVGHAK